MPRLKANAPKRDAPRVFVRLIKKNLDIAGCETLRELAPKVHIAESTLYARMRHPEEFKFCEICRIVSALKLNENEVSELAQALREGGG